MVFQLQPVAFQWSRSFSRSPLHLHRVFSSTLGTVTADAACLAIPSTPSPLDFNPLSNQLRILMRRFSHSVVVCTTSHPTATGSVPRAMTMSSFTSLALTPRPLVTFNVKAPSATLDAVIASRVFNIHVLSGDHQGARVAEWFTRGNRIVDPFQGIEALGDGWQAALKAGEPPALEGLGVLTRLRCKLLDDGEGHEKGVVRVSDHVIILGEVEEVVVGDGVKGEFALTYADRSYRTEGTAIQGHVVTNRK